MGLLGEQLIAQLGTEQAILIIAAIMDQAKPAHKQSPAPIKQRGLSGVSAIRLSDSIRVRSDNDHFVTNPPTHCLRRDLTRQEDSHPLSPQTALPQQNLPLPVLLPLSLLD
jgi:hypothetical protein